MYSSRSSPPLIPDESKVQLSNIKLKYKTLNDAVMGIRNYLMSLEENKPFNTLLRGDSSPHFNNLEILCLICYCNSYKKIKFDDIEHLTVVKNPNCNVSLIIKLVDKESFCMGYLHLLRFLYKHKITGLS